MPEAITILACPHCGALDAGPRELCPRCHRPGLEPHPVAGTGRLLSWTTVRRPPSAFREEGPYSVAVVDLDAGVRVTGRLTWPHPELAPGTAVTCTEVRAGYPIFQET